jgi:hypothetical protein
MNPTYRGEKKGKEKNPQHYLTPVATKVLQHHHYQT